MNTSVAHPVVGERPLPNPPTSPLAPRRDGAVAPPLRAILAVLAIALMPFPIVLHGWGNPKLSYDYVTILFPVDLALAGLLIVGSAPLARRVRARSAGPGTVVLALLAIVMSAALLVHPTARGLHTVFELWGVVVLTGTLAESISDGIGSLPLGAVGAVAVMEAVWSTAQLVTGSGLGLTRLGEDAHPLWPFSPTVSAPLGSMAHPYVLAGLALVASGALAWKALTGPRPAPWLALATLAVVPVGFTFSRAGLIGGALLVGGFVAGAVRPGRHRRRSALAALLLCVGMAVPAAIWSAGWRNRAAQTTAATSANQLTTDRTQLDHEALVLLGAHPLTGVGPGQYVPAVQARFRTESDKRVPNFRPVHNVVLLVGAEGGVLALIVIAALFALVGWRALRSGPAAIGVYLAYLPFCMLDHFAYSFPQGLVLTAIWLGVLDAMGRRRAASLT